MRAQRRRRKVYEARRQLERERTKEASAVAARAATLGGGGGGGGGSAVQSPKKAKEFSGIGHAGMFQSADEDHNGASEHARVCVTALPVSRSCTYACVNKQVQVHCLMIVRRTSLVRSGSLNLQEFCRMLYRQMKPSAPNTRITASSSPSPRHPFARDNGKQGGFSRYSTLRTRICAHTCTCTCTCAHAHAHMHMQRNTERR